jgi:hypothetical protein
MAHGKVGGEGSSRSGKTTEEDYEEFPEENGFFPQALLGRCEGAVGIPFPKGKSFQENYEKFHDFLTRVPPLGIIMIRVCFLSRGPFL